jgi:LmbE family N-acetylglucosaminyl deacetylase
MSTKKIDGDVTISGTEAASVIRHLSERIEVLEARLVQEQLSKAEELAKQIPEVIKYLRMHSVVLLYTGEGRASDLADHISEDEAAVAALGQAWNLQDAPLPQSAIDQIRALTLGGMNRF